ncbi:alpha/beta hydrolase [Amycolatopsis carbonis]|uniref:Alpha/beta hydrolase n=1 Tax=Amycolatopsis carbonis TaxID=715471 RepID=A0A9Y2IMB9_9PSEU|nr:alpha/beta hydrolase [Amycolatopsis sp. 2-15]WIX81994.1 alpha/beta hydrolase [Amycolatopsis sp. 2-15]
MATVDLDVTEHGAGEPLLLIHGGGAAEEMLPLHREPELAARCRLISFRRRDYRRNAGDAPVSIRRHAEDCRLVLDSCGVDKAHVLGKSSGGLIALQLTVDAPARVQTLCLLEPALLSVPDGAAFFASVEPVLEIYRAGDTAAAVDAFFTAVWGADWKAEYDRVVPGGPQRVEQAAATIFESELPAVRSWDFGADQATTIEQPVLYLLGSESLPVFAQGRDLVHAWLPQTEDATLPGLNHLLQVRDPAGVARALAGFLARHPLRSR